MPVHIVWNTIKDPIRRERLERAVLAALATRPQEEHWDVKLTESDALPGWTAVIVAPDKTRVAWYFHGPGEEDSPALVRTRIETLLRAAGL